MSAADLLRLARRALVTALCCGLLLPWRAASAQVADLEPLRDRLDAAAFRTVTQLVDSARAAGLPTAPLISKAQEGLLKRASPAAIVTATRGLLLRLRQSREALGADATGAELEAGASALRVGAASQQLTELRLARPRQGVTVPLVVLADLLARGVPRDTAARAVQAMASANATDAAFSALRLSIERDISSGMSPAAAAGARYRSILARQP
jgi:hypothetical protein